MIIIIIIIIIMVVIIIIIMIKILLAGFNKKLEQLYASTPITILF